MDNIGQAVEEAGYRSENLLALIDVNVGCADGFGSFVGGFDLEGQFANLEEAASSESYQGQGYGYAGSCEGQKEKLLIDIADFSATFGVCIAKFSVSNHETS